MNILKREIPNKKIIDWREQFLNNLRNVLPENLDNNSIGLEQGNSKLGQKGEFYNSVYVWNLPSVSTCPGASEWCMKNCYNADTRTDKFPIEKWQTNWWQVINKKNDLKNYIIKQLKESQEPCAVRLHSSGDFFSVDYINFWFDIIEMNPKVSFWAYTRSWIIDELYLPLRHLNSLKNMQLFASWDYTMSENPPSDWRKSIVVDSLSGIEKLDKSKDFSCPEQFGEKPNCASCGFCIKASHKNIIFTLH